MCLKKKTNNSVCVCVEGPGVSRCIWEGPASVTHCTAPLWLQAAHPPPQVTAALLGRHRQRLLFLWNKRWKIMLVLLLQLENKTRLVLEKGDAKNLVSCIVALWDARPNQNVPWLVGWEELAKTVARHMYVDLVKALQDSLRWKVRVRTQMFEDRTFVWPHHWAYP